MIPASRVGGAAAGINTTPGINTPGAPDGDSEFELEVDVEGKTIQCIVGASSLARLPRALWDSDTGGGRAVRIVPVLFTQGIDIQQSMSHAARDSREKAAFQVPIEARSRHGAPSCFLWCFVPQHLFFFFRPRWYMYPFISELAPARRKGGGGCAPAGTFFFVLRIYF